MKNAKIDWVLVITLLLLLIYGLVTVYSATFKSDQTQFYNNFSKQILWVLSGLIVCTVITLMPTSWLYSITPGLYSFFIILLLLLEFVPHSGGTTSRWFQLGSIQIQPSEFMKPVMVLALARFLSKENHSPDKINNLFFVFLLVLFPFVLVLKQPDLGTSLAFLVLTIPMLYWRGLSGFVIFVICAPLVSFIAAFNFWTFFFAIILISAALLYYHRGAIVFWLFFALNISVGILAPVFWGKLHSYQQQRILTFLGIVSDPHGVGYQIIQSKVAIGSGGFFGKGLLQGTQTQLRFLPAQHTDFIFSVLAEEWGFIGSLVVLVTFFIFLYRSVQIAAHTQNLFSSLLTIGAVTIFAFQVFVNIGMTLGIMPVTGLPLPFISYGGSSMISSMILAGLILNTAVRRFVY
ncbi:MAG: rod shape-determining protein RodA [Actinobacteria bacterium]|nr:rod shape-determining protein RodA [Actinomycetota bacterium]